MRHLMTAAVLSLLIGAAAALPAAADNGERSARERSLASHAYDGGRAAQRYRQHFAYAALRQGYDHEAWPRRPRRVHGAMHPVRKARSARQSHARVARAKRLFRALQLENGDTFFQTAIGPGQAQVCLVGLLAFTKFGAARKFDAPGAKRSSNVPSNSK